MIVIATFILACLGRKRAQSIVEGWYFERVILAFTVGAPRRQLLHHLLMRLLQMQRVLERLVLVALHLAAHRFRLFLLSHQAQLREDIKADTGLTGLKKIVRILSILLRRHLLQFGPEHVILDFLAVATGAVLETQDYALRSCDVR